MSGADKLLHLSLFALFVLQLYTGGVSLSET